MLDRQRIWDTAYASAFVREFYDHGKDFGFASALERQRQCAEEAISVADTALEALDQARAAEGGSE